MDLIHFIIFVCAVYLAIVAGRMSMKNDMRRRFESIEERGQSLRTVGDVINCILQLRDSIESLEYENKALTNSLNIANDAREKIERAYKVLLEHLKEKREECEELKNEMEILRKDNNHLEDNLSKAREMFDRLMAKANKLAEEMNNECGEVIDKGSKYAKAMDMSATRLIYAHKLHNKTTLLTAGVCAFGKNGNISYPAGSRSLGNAQSKENAECFAKLTASLNLNAGESKRIGVIYNYEALKACAKTFSGIEHGVTKVMGISAELVNFLALNKGMLNKIK